jgi:hypothetical protein
VKREVEEDDMARAVYNGFELATTFARAKTTKLIILIITIEVLQ